MFSRTQSVIARCLCHLMSTQKRNMLNLQCHKTKNNSKSLHLIRWTQMLLGIFHVIWLYTWINLPMSFLWAFLYSENHPRKSRISFQPWHGWIIQASRQVKYGTQHASPTVHDKVIVPTLLLFKPFLLTSSSANKPTPRIHLLRKPHWSCIAQ